MRLFKKIFGSKNKENDEPFEIQRDDFLRSSTSSGIANNKGCDQIPGAHGHFGITPTNPIPVNGVVGEMVYIFRLRTKTGVGFLYHRLDSLSSPPSKNPIDYYELVAADASEWYDLYFDCYYPRRSTKVPAGLTLISWGSLDETLKILSKLPFYGTNTRVDNFPFGLPDVIESCGRLNDFSPGLGAAAAKKIRQTLDTQQGKWKRDRNTDKKQPSYNDQISKNGKKGNNVHITIDNDMKRSIDILAEKGKDKGYLTYDEINYSLPVSIKTEHQIDVIISSLLEKNIHIIDDESGKSQKANNDGHYNIQSRFAEYLAFLMPFFTNYEEIKTLFKFKNEPHDLNGLIDFALFLDITTNLPSIFSKQCTIDMRNVIHRFVKDSVDIIPKLNDGFGETRIRKATERIMFYANLLKDDLKNHDTRNDQSVHEFLKEVFSGQITEEEKVVLTNMLTYKLPPIMELIFMKTNGTETMKSDEMTKKETMTADDYYKRGMKLYSTDKYSDALKYLSQVLIMRPNSSSVYYYIADIYERLEDYDKSIIFINKAIDLDPTWYAPYGLRGDLKMEFKQFDGAITDFSKAIELNPDDTDSYFNRSLVYDIKNQYSEAEKDLLSVLKIQPNDKQAQEKLRNINEKVQKNNISFSVNDKKVLPEQKNGNDIGTAELGEKYCFLVLDTTQHLFDEYQLMKDLGINKTNDSVREIHILNMFSVFHCIKKSISLSSDIKDSIIHYIIDSYMAFVIEHAREKGNDEEILLGEAESLKILMERRFTQYSEILKKYETILLKKDKTDDTCIEYEIGSDLMKVLNNITSHEYNENNLLTGLNFFAFFFDVIMDKQINDAIHSDVGKYDIRKSEILEEMQKYLGKEYKVTKNTDGGISIKRE